MVLTWYLAQRDLIHSDERERYSYLVSSGLGLSRSVVRRCRYSHVRMRSRTSLVAGKTPIQYLAAARTFLAQARIFSWSDAYAVKVA